MRAEPFLISTLQKICLFLICFGLEWAAAAGQSVSEGRRLVSLAPSATEWIAALGLVGLLEGVTEQCDYPPEVRSKAKVGSYMRASIERVLALRATDVVVADPLPEVMKRRFEAAGVRVHVFAPQRLEDFPTSIRDLGVALGSPQAAEQWSERFRSAIASRPQTVVLSKQKPRRALMFVSVEPIYVVGNSQWLSDVFRLAGFENAFREVRIKDAFPRLSFEALIRLDAQVWFGFSADEASKGSQQEKLRVLSQRVSRQLKPEIHILSADIFQRPGPRLLDAIAQLKGHAL